MFLFFFKYIKIYSYKQLEVSQKSTYLTAQLL